MAKTASQQNGMHFEKTNYKILIFSVVIVGAVEIPHLFGEFVMLWFLSVAIEWAMSNENIYSFEMISMNATRLWMKRTNYPIDRIPQKFAYGSHKMMHHKCGWKERSVDQIDKDFRQKICQSPSHQQFNTFKMCVWLFYSVVFDCLCLCARQYVFINIDCVDLIKPGGS